MINQILNYLKYGFYLVGAFLAVFLFWCSFHYVVPIMMYHNVEDIEGHQSTTVSVEIFEKHMRFLDKYGYNVISLDELVKGIESGVKFPRNTVVITFDDGYLDNYENAYPILKKYNMQATFFVPFNDIGREGFVSFDHLKQMIKDGFTIGSHTLTHKYLPDASIEDQAYEIKQSKISLEEAFDVRVDYFAYPVGGFTEESKRLVKEAGYKGAVATNRGYDRDNKDVFELNRIKMSDKDSNEFLIFWKMTGYWTILKSQRAPY